MRGLAGGIHPRSGSLLCVWLALVPAIALAAPEKLPTIADKTAGFEKRSGLLDFYLDRNTGTVWLELPAPVLESLYLGNARRILNWAKM